MDGGCAGLAGGKLEPVLSCMQFVSRPSPSGRSAPTGTYLVSFAYAGAGDRTFYASFHPAGLCLILARDVVLESGVSRRRCLTRLA